MTDSGNIWGSYDPAASIASSVAAKKEEGEADTAAIPSRVSPSKGWNFNAATPRILLPKYESIDHIKELSCGCNCIECKTTYKAYWDEKSLSNEYRKALAIERDAVMEATNAVKVVEKEYEEIIHNLRQTITVDKQRIVELQLQLEKEKQRHLEDKYERDLQYETMKLTNAEGKKTMQQLLAIQDDYFILKKEYTDVKSTSNTLKTAKDRAFFQLKDYEQCLSTLETANGSLRTRCNETEIELAKANRKIDALKERLYNLQEDNKNISSRLNSNINVVSKHRSIPNNRMKYMSRDSMSLTSGYTMTPLGADTNPSVQTPYLGSFNHSVSTTATSTASTMTSKLGTISMLRARYSK